MATIQLTAGTRTYTNTAASDDYVMRFGSFNDIKAFTGTYTVNSSTTPTSANPFPQDGADKYVIELVNIVDPITGQPKFPLVFPALVLSTSPNAPLGAPIGSQVIGDNAPDTLTLQWFDQRLGGPLTVNINGFDPTGMGSGSAPARSPAQADSVRIRLLEGTGTNLVVTAELDQRFDQFWTNNQPSLALKSYTVEESVVLDTYQLLDFNESPLISIVLRDDLVNNSILASDFASAFRSQVHQFAMDKNMVS
jgi:hypothetical protein